MRRRVTLKSLRNGGLGQPGIATIIEIRMQIEASDRA